MTLSPAAVLVVACVVLALNMGVRQGFGLFLEPISFEHGWPREVFSLGMAIQVLVWGMAQPVAGALGDRFGPPVVVAASGVLYAAGVALMAVSHTPSALYLASLIVGVAISGASFSVVFIAVARITPVERRSTALGIATAGASFGMFVGPLLTQAFIVTLGWAGALYALAAVTALIVPLALPLGGGPSLAAPQAGPQQSLWEALAEASRHSGFWYLFAGFFVCGFQLVFIATHLPAFIVACGLPAEMGAWSLALVGLFNIAGAYGAGVAGGVWRKKYLLSLIYAGRAAVIVLFMVLPKTGAVVLGFAALMGVLWLSTVPLTSGLVAQIFGPKHMATLFGLVFLSHQVGSFLGGWLGGLTYDVTGSYDLMWIVSILLGLLAAVLHWPIADRPVARLETKPA